MIDEENVKEIVKTIESISGLREMLFLELDRLRNNQITTKKAQMISRLATNILDTARIEMAAYQRPLNDAFLALPEHPSLDIEKE